MAVQDIVGRRSSVDTGAMSAVIRCVEECYACAQLCDRFADACLATRPVPTQSIRLSLDCAEMCAAAGAIANRRIGKNTAIIKAALEVCAAACRACAAVGERQGAHELGRECARACRSCEQACVEAVAEL